MSVRQEKKETVERVMHAFKEGGLTSGGGKPVKKRERAIAIALSEAGDARNKGENGNRARHARTESKERRTRD